MAYFFKTGHIKVTKILPITTENQKTGHYGLLSLGYYTQYITKDDSKKR